MSAEDYIQEYKEAVINDSKQSGVPASISMVQGILESDSGNSRLAKVGNNHFGIKKHNWTGPVMPVDDDRPGELFRMYPDFAHSLADHSYFLRSNTRYADLFTIPKWNYKAWALGLQNAGYATNPNYARELIRIIEKYDLDKLDKQVTIEKVATVTIFVSVAALLALLIIFLIKYRST